MKPEITKPATTANATETATETAATETAANEATAIEAAGVESVGNEATEIISKDLTCVVCPKGCKITVDLSISTVQNDLKAVESTSPKLVKILNITGNTCKHGEKYAITECTHPVRTLTTTAKVQNHDLISVKSTEPLPKERMMEFMNLINQVELKSPVRIGDIVLENIGGTGINIVATKNS